MILKLLHKTLAVCMALLVFISTVSFTINSHYCGDTLVDTAFFKEAKSCGMETQGIMASGECSIMKKNCCTNEQILIEGQEELKFSAENLSVEDQLVTASLIFTYFNLFEGLENNITSFNDYSPPLVEKDIQALYEVYLI